MGLSDMLIKLGIRYGSKEAIEICDEIGFTMARAAIYRSIILAKEEGSNFSKKKINKIINSDFFDYNATGISKKLIKEYGIKNGQLLTIAPTGSLSNVLGVSGGIEPIFANSYTRKTESLHNEDTYYKVYTPIVKEYMDRFGIKDEKDLPDYFVTAQDIPYEERIKMQAVWQTHIDNAISSTVNLPESATVEDIEDLYMKAWENGLKGITVFRDNCKRVGVLTTSDKKEDKSSEQDKQQDEVIKDSVEAINDLKEVSETLCPARGEIIKVTDKNIHGLKRKLITGCGSLHCEAFFDINTGQLVETFLSKGSTGGCNNFMVGLSRFISMAARLGASIYDIVDQLKSTGSCPSYAVRRAVQGDTSIGSCCPMAVGNALLDMYEEFNKIGKYSEKENNNFKITIPEDTLDKYKNQYIKVDHLYRPESVIYKEYVQSQTNSHNIIYREEALCPQCHSVLDHEGGCNICRNCGYTKCD